MTAPTETTENLNEIVEVRTTFRPDETVKVTGHERENLRALGVLYTGQAKTDEGARTAVEKQQTEQSQ